LALSAFVYVPFGGEVMQLVQVEVFGTGGGGWLGGMNGTWIGGRGAAVVNEKRTAKGVWLTDVSHARRKLNPSRLQDQMFAYTVTNQIINTFTEIGLPYILRFIGSVRNGKGGNGARGTGGKKKRVGFEDEVVGRQQQQPQQEVGGGSPEKGTTGVGAEKVGAENDKEEKEDREFLERVRREVALPPYDLFGDYSEMITQFGYVVLWSTIWPLAPGGLAVFL
jgi:anoctamin-10